MEGDGTVEVESRRGKESGGLYTTFLFKQLNEIKKIGVEKETADWIAAALGDSSLQINSLPL